MNPDEPIPLNLLSPVPDGTGRRKTHVTVGPVRPKHHPISSELINYGQVPFGYKDLNGTLHKDPLEQFVLKQIKNMRDEGSSLNCIAKYLTKSGVPFTCPHKYLWSLIKAPTHFGSSVWQITYHIYTISILVNELRLLPIKSNGF